MPARLRRRPWDIVSIRLPRGLYAITDTALIGGERMVSAVAAAITGGAVMVQYRDKGGVPARRLREAQALLDLCRERHVPLIINDDMDLAAAVGADGVHLGRDDICLTQARERLGDTALIGISCYNRLDLACAAEAAGADYVAFGSFFSSSTKLDAVRADVALLHTAKQHLTVPVVAIGGITADNGAALVASGADMLAVISDLFAVADIRAAAEALSKLF